MALLVGGFAFWWYFSPFPWLGALMALVGGLFTYLILTTRRIERFRRLFFIGLFVVVFTSFFIIIEVWNPDIILSWAPEHLSWMEYYIEGEAPGALSFPCNRSVPQVFFGQATYLTNLFSWQTPFPTTLGAFLMAMSPFLITGIVFGRGFCGWVCPFGGLPEVMATGEKERWQLNFLNKNIKTADGFQYTTPKEWVKDTKYGILLAIILLSVFLSFPVVCALCPALWLSFIPVFWVVTGLVVVFVIVLPFINKRRWWCYNICPIGAICSLLDKISLFRIKIDKQKCIRCMSCVKKCRMYAMAPDYVDGKGTPNTNCIRCGRCMDVCPTEAIDINLVTTPLKAKRLFISLAVIAVMAWYIWFVTILWDKFINLF